MMTPNNKGEASKEHWEFGLLPKVSEAVSKSVLDWMSSYNQLADSAKKEFIERIINWLGETGNEELAGAIRGLTEGLLESMYEELAHKLTKAEWDALLLNMRYSHLVVLRAVNEALREQKG